MVTIPAPENWEKIVAFTQSPRNTFDEIRRARPDQEMVRKSMTEFLSNCKYERCAQNEGYIKAMGIPK
jgi:hypothetical protein